MCDSDSGLSISMNGSNMDLVFYSSNATVIKISIPSINLEKVYNFCSNDVIADIKLSVITDLGLDFNDILNYGLFLPPINGKAGKFLQENRLLKEYPFPNSGGNLEFKYKQRIYRTLPANLAKLRKQNSKANLRQFLSLVKIGDLDKVLKLLEKGVDPNFQCRDSGETPLTVAVQKSKPKNLIMALVAGGAHLDYRAADSRTPLHRAAICGNYESIKVLLDLGQSPNTLDSVGLTPLYHCVLNESSAMCAERLLFDHSVIGIKDNAGLEEIHQACRFGRVQHLEQLLAYGADINSQTTANGNTPLHFCAYNGHESCTRLLLFRGADRTLKNRAAHTACQEAGLSNQASTVALIRDFRDEDVVPLRGCPKYNQQRRPLSPIRRLGQRCSSMNRLASTTSNDCDRLSLTHIQPDTPSPSPTIKSPISESKISGQHSRLQTSVSNYALPHGHDFIDKSAPTVRTMRGSQKPLRGIRKNANFDTGSMESPSHPPLCNGPQTIGRYQLHNRPQLCMPGFQDATDNTSLCSYASTFTERYPDNGTIRSTALDYGSLRTDKTTSIMDLDLRHLPRVVVLQKGSCGFGFVVQSKRATGGAFVPTEVVPSLHYLGHVEENNAAHRAGLRPGDFILQVNESEMSTLCHQNVVEAIRNSGEMLSLKVVTLPSENQTNGTVKGIRRGVYQETGLRTLGRQFQHTGERLASPRSIKSSCFDTDEDPTNAGLVRPPTAQTANGNTGPPSFGFAQQLSHKQTPSPPLAPPPPPPPPPPMHKALIPTTPNGFINLKKSSLQPGSSPPNIPAPNSKHFAFKSQSDDNPPPPSLFHCKTEGAVNPLLASVLSKFEAAENGGTFPQRIDTPVVPIQLSQRQLPAGSASTSFEENLRAAIARRRMQMDQSSESEDDVRGAVLSSNSHPPSTTITNGFQPTESLAGRFPDL